MSITRNAIANMLGGLLPALVMLVTLPFIVRHLGTADYGLLTMVMAITGYFALVDINVTAGSVKFIAEHHARGDDQRSAEVITFGLLFYLTAGLIGGALIYFGAPALIAWLMKLPAAKVPEAVQVMQIAGVGFLFGLLQAYLNSIPQAVQRFDITAPFEAFFGVGVPLATVALLAAGGSLVQVVILRVAASGVHAIALAIAANSILPNFKLTRPGRDTCMQVMAFSGYSFLSRIAATTHAHADKLIVGSAMGLTALAYYSVAGQVVSRVTGMIFRLSSALFPAASAMQARGEMDELGSIYMTATRYITYLNGAAVLLICLFGREILFYWMGPDFATQAYWVMVFISIALFIDSLTVLPSLVNDAFGKPANTGVFAVLRALLATALTLAFVGSQSIALVAFAHTLSAFFMVSAFLWFVHGRSLPWHLFEVMRDAWLRPMLILVVVAACVAISRSSGVMSLPLAVSGFIATCLALALAGSFGVLKATHRHATWRWLRSIKHHAA